MDYRVASCVVDFVLAQPDADDHLLVPLLAIVPFPYLRKRLLVRRLRCDPAVLERSLEVLELLGDLDGGDGAASRALAAAYAAVAANCSVRCLREGRGFEEAFERVWGRRAGDAVRGGARLQSAELEKWGSLLERAHREVNVRRLVLSVNTERKAADAVEDYLNEVSQEIGRPAVEVAVVADGEERVGVPVPAVTFEGPLMEEEDEGVDGDVDAQHPEGFEERRE